MLQRKYREAKREARIARQALRNIDRERSDESDGDTDEIVIISKRRRTPKRKTSRTTMETQTDPSSGHDHEGTRAVPITLKAKIHLKNATIHFNISTYIDSQKCRICKMTRCTTESYVY